MLCFGVGAPRLVIVPPVDGVHVPDEVVHGGVLVVFRRHHVDLWCCTMAGPSAHPAPRPPLSCPLCVLPACSSTIVLPPHILIPLPASSTCSPGFNRPPAPPPTPRFCLAPSIRGTGLPHSQAIACAPVAREARKLGPAKRHGQRTDRSATLQASPEYHMRQQIELPRLSTAGMVPGAARAAPWTMSN